MDGTGRSSFTGLFSRRAALSLAVFESSLYWVDDGGLWQVPHSRPDQKRFISKAVLPVLAVHHQLQQPQGALRFNSNLSRSPLRFLPHVLGLLTCSNVLLSSSLRFFCVC